MHAGRTTFKHPDNAAGVSIDALFNDRFFGVSGGARFQSAAVA